MYTKSKEFNENNNKNFYKVSKWKTKTKFITVQLYIYKHIGFIPIDFFQREVIPLYLQKSALSKIAGHPV